MGFRRQDTLFGATMPDTFIRYNVQMKPLLMLTAGLLFLVMVAVGCVGHTFVSPLPSPIDTPNPLAVSDKAKAIKLGKLGCNEGHAVQDEEPSIIDAQLLPLSDAGKLADEPTSRPSYNLPDDTPIWVVRMQGKWHLEGGPVPTSATNEPIVYYNYCAVLIDARTGFSMGYRLRQTAP